ncbi:MAG: hypothetical protein LAO07_04580 [Acidobacteriia bacterium]|nr:hypothetical protein [Terriglobia bacterium]
MPRRFFSVAKRTTAAASRWWSISKPSSIPSSSARWVSSSAKGSCVALVDSTTRGCSVVIAGLDLQPEDEVVTTDQEHFGLTHEQLRYSKQIYRHYGNMSSATVLFVLDEVIREGDPQPGDWGVMIALGPGMAAETALLRW